MGATESAPQPENNKCEDENAEVEEESEKPVQEGESPDAKNGQASGLNEKAEQSEEISGLCEDMVVAEVGEANSSIVSQKEEIQERIETLREEVQPLENKDSDRKMSPNEDDELSTNTEKEVKLNEVNKSFKHFCSSIGLKFTLKKDSDTTPEVSPKKREVEGSTPEDITADNAGENTEQSTPEDMTDDTIKELFGDKPKDVADNTLKELVDEKQKETTEGMPEEPTDKPQNDLLDDIQEMKISDAPLEVVNDEPEEQYDFTTFCPTMTDHTFRKDLNETTKEQTLEIIEPKEESTHEELANKEEEVDEPAPPIPLIEEMSPFKRFFSIGKKHKQAKQEPNKDSNVEQKEEVKKEPKTKPNEEPEKELNKERNDEISEGVTENSIPSVVTEEPAPTLPDVEEEIVSPFKKFFTSGIFAGLKKKKKLIEEEMFKDENVEKKQEMQSINETEGVKTPEEAEHEQESTKKEISLGVDTIQVVEREQDENEIQEIVATTSEAVTDSLTAKTSIVSKLMNVFKTSDNQENVLEKQADKGLQSFISNETERLSSQEVDKGPRCSISDNLEDQLPSWGFVTVVTNEVEINEAELLSSQEKTQSVESLELQSHSWGFVTVTEDFPEDETAPEALLNSNKVNPLNSQEKAKSQGSPVQDIFDEQSPSWGFNTVILNDVEILSSQEKDKNQGSPLRKLLSGAGLKKLSRKRRGMKLDELTGSGEHVAEDLLSSTESAECQKGESPSSLPEKAAEVNMSAQVGSSHESDGDVTSDGERKKDGTWTSLKKRMTPKRHPKRSSESEDDLGLVGSSEGEKVLEHSTEEPKKKVDISVSWEALLCGSAKRRGIQISDSEEEAPTKEGETLSEPGNSESQLDSSQEGGHEGESTWKSFKKLVTSKRKAKTEETCKVNLSEQIISDSEIAKDESSFSLKKLIPGHKKRKHGRKQETIYFDQVDRDVGSDYEEDSETPAVVPMSEFDAEELGEKQNNLTEVVIETASHIIKDERVSSLDIESSVPKKTLPIDAIKAQAEDTVKQLAQSTSPDFEDPTEFISKHQQLSDIPEEGIIEETIVTQLSTAEEATRDDTIAEDLIELTSEAFTAPEPQDEETTEMVSAVSQLTDESPKTSGNTTPVPLEYELKDTEVLLHEAVETIGGTSTLLLITSKDTHLEAIAKSVSPQIFNTPKEMEATVLMAQEKTAYEKASTDEASQEINDYDESPVTMVECLSEISEVVPTELASGITETFDALGIATGEIENAENESIPIMQIETEKDQLIELVNKLKEARPEHLATIDSEEYVAHIEREVVEESNLQLDPECLEMLVTDKPIVRQPHTEVTCEEQKEEFLDVAQNAADIENAPVSETNTCDVQSVTGAIPDVPLSELPDVLESLIAIVAPVESTQKMYPVGPLRPVEEIRPVHVANINSEVSVAQVQWKVVAEDNPQPDTKSPEVWVTEKCVFIQPLTEVIVEEEEIMDDAQNATAIENASVAETTECEVHDVTAAMPDISILGPLDITESCIAIMAPEIEFPKKMDPVGSLQPLEEKRSVLAALVNSEENVAPIEGKVVTEDNPLPDTESLEVSVTEKYVFIQPLTEFIVEEEKEEIMDDVQNAAVMDSVGSMVEVEDMVVMKNVTSAQFVDGHAIQVQVMDTELKSVKEIVKTALKVGSTDFSNKEILVQEMEGEFELAEANVATILEVSSSDDQEITLQMRDTELSGQATVDNVLEVGSTYVIDQEILVKEVDIKIELAEENIETTIDISSSEAQEITVKVADPELNSAQEIVDTSLKVDSTDVSDPEILVKEVDTEMELAKANVTSVLEVGSSEGHEIALQVEDAELTSAQVIVDKVLKDSTDINDHTILAQQMDTEIKLAVASVDTNHEVSSSNNAKITVKAAHPELMSSQIIVDTSLKVDSTDVNDHAIVVQQMYPEMKLAEANIETTPEVSSRDVHEITVKAAHLELMSSQVIVDNSLKVDSTDVSDHLIVLQQMDSEIELAEANVEKFLEVSSCDDQQITVQMTDAELKSAQATDINVIEVYSTDVSDQEMLVKELDSKIELAEANIEATLKVGSSDDQEITVKAADPEIKSTQVIVDNLLKVDSTDVSDQDILVKEVDGKIELAEANIETTPELSPSDSHGHCHEITVKAADPELKSSQVIVDTSFKVDSTHVNDHSIVVQQMDSEIELAEASVDINLEVSSSYGPEITVKAADPVLKSTPVIVDTSLKVDSTDVNDHAIVVQQMDAEMKLAEANIETTPEVSSSDDHEVTIKMADPEIIFTQVIVDTSLKVDSTDVNDHVIVVQQMDTEMELAKANVTTVLEVGSSEGHEVAVQMVDAELMSAQVIVDKVLKVDSTDINDHSIVEQQMDSEIELAVASVYTNLEVSSSDDAEITVNAAVPVLKSTPVIVDTSLKVDSTDVNDHMIKEQKMNVEIKSAEENVKTTLEVSSSDDHELKIKAADPEIISTQVIVDNSPKVDTTDVSDPEILVKAVDSKIELAEENIETTPELSSSDSHGHCHEITVKAADPDLMSSQVIVDTSLKVDSTDVNYPAIVVQQMDAEMKLAEANIETTPEVSTSDDHEITVKAADPELMSSQVIVDTSLKVDSTDVSDPEILIKEVDSKIALAEGNVKTTVEVGPNYDQANKIPVRDPEPKYSQVIVDNVIELGSTDVNSHKIVVQPLDAEIKSAEENLETTLEVCSTNNNEIAIQVAEAELMSAHAIIDNMLEVGSTNVTDHEILVQDMYVESKSAEASADAVLEVALNDVKAHEIQILVTNANAEVGSAEAIVETVHELISSTKAKEVIDVCDKMEDERKVCNATKEIVEDMFEEAIITQEIFQHVQLNSSEASTNGVLQSRKMSEVELTSEAEGSKPPESKPAITVKTCQGHLFVTAQVQKNIHLFENKSALNTMVNKQEPLEKENDLPTAVQVDICEDRTFAESNSEVVPHDSVPNTCTKSCSQEDVQEILGQEAECIHTFEVDRSTDNSNTIGKQRKDLLGMAGESAKESVESFEKRLSIESHVHIHLHIQPRDAGVVTAGLDLSPLAIRPPPSTTAEDSSNTNSVPKESSESTTFCEVSKNEQNIYAATSVPLHIPPALLDMPLAPLQTQPEPVLCTINPEIEQVMTNVIEPIQHIEDENEQEEWQDAEEDFSAVQSDAFEVPSNQTGDGAEETLQNYEEIFDIALEPQSFLSGGEI